MLMPMARTQWKLPRRKRTWPSRTTTKTITRMTGLGRTWIVDETDESTMHPLDDEEDEELIL